MSGFNLIRFAIFLISVLYSIVDIETTGSRPGPNTITEIAVIVTDGYEIKTRFETLLRPAGPIPYFVQRLTGISNEMTENAPLFEEIAEELEAILANTVFVAHNVNFDYSFIKREFMEVGIDWRSQRMCTVKMTRHFHPGLGRYNLGALCQFFEINNKAAHRAMGDCEATYFIFSSIVKRFGEESVNVFFKKQNKSINLPHSLPTDLLQNIPSLPGVYYFKDASGTNIYIGKASNLAGRVRSHFNSKLDSTKVQSFIKEIAQIDFVLCGNPLVAAIMEDREIRKFRPKHNKAQREIISAFGIFPYTDGKGVERLTIESIKTTLRSEIIFATQQQAKSWLHKFATVYQVPPGQLGLPSLWAQTSDDLPLNRTLHQDFLEAVNAGVFYVFIGPGRSEDEKSWVRWIPGKSVSYLFTDGLTQFESQDELWESAETIALNSTLEAILTSASMHPKKWGMEMLETKRTVRNGSF